MNLPIFTLLFACILPLQAMGCPFCDPEVIERQTVLETANFRVLADYAPINYGHMLLVPKKHVERLDDLDPMLGTELLTLQRRVSHAFQELLRVQDTTLIEKNGSAAGQSVPHVHFHLIPMQPHKWQTLAHLRVFLRILFGSRPTDPKELHQVVTLFRAHFTANTTQD
jgi:diadenosine tetraphosphate (Ap4A) HIT family hydrolase